MTGEKSTSHVIFPSIREASRWRNEKKELGSIWTDLSREEKGITHPESLLDPEKRKIFNRNTFPTKNEARALAKTKECQQNKGTWATFKCEKVSAKVNGHTYRSAYILGCKSPDCYLCHSSYATKRARETWGRPSSDPDKTTGAMRFLNAGNGISWWYFVGTFPKNLHAHITADRIKMVRDFFWRSFRRWALERAGLWSQDYGHEVDMGCMEVMHPEGEKAGKDGKKNFHPHLNFIIPAVAVGTYRNKNGVRFEGKKLKVYFEKPELLELCELWRKAVVLTFGLENVLVQWRTYEKQNGEKVHYEGGITEPNIAVFHSSYRGKISPSLTEKEAIREQKHCLKYNFRSFPGWPAWTRRINRYGFLASRRISKFREYWELWDSVDYSEPVSCPCGAEIDIQTVDDRDLTNEERKEAFRDVDIFNGLYFEPGGL